MCSLCRFTLCITILALSPQSFNGELFASTHDMKALAILESQLIINLTDYIRTQSDNLRLLQAKLEQLKEVRPPDQSVEEVIGDPINAYTLVRRLAREWPLILNLMTTEFDVLDDFDRLPKEEEYYSAARGIVRLQTTYELDIRELAQGRRSSSRLTGLDCFELGKYSVYLGHYGEAVSWLRTALDKTANGDLTLKEKEVLPHLFYATTCMEGSKSGNASNILRALMTYYPNHTLDSESSPFVRDALSGHCSNYMDKNDTGGIKKYYNEIYKRTCRGIGLSYSSEAKCFYVHYNNPRLLIAPFKMEEINVDPPLLLFHNVISDQEIEEIKTAFTLVREACQVDAAGVAIKTFLRTCDVGWLVDNTSEVSRRVSRRVGDMTDLAMESSEPNQVASYGLAGEYVLHYDPIEELDLSLYEHGNRIATLMFYLSDVEEGGYTVFPLINKAVAPAKGSAVFWFNLDHLGQNNPIMLHGGCPVAKGSKWVLNKWIHERGQNNGMFCPVDKKFPKPRYYMSSIK